MRSISLAQLPFRSLNYFPAPRYLDALEAKYREVLGSESAIPRKGIWEPPPWITWVRAAIRSALYDRKPNAAVNVLDLSRCEFDFASVMAALNNTAKTDVYCFSPLTQNIGLTTSVAAALRSQGHIAVAGGPVAAYLDPACFDAIFIGRIETQYERFTSWLADVLAVPRTDLHISTESYAQHIDYSWVSREYHEATIYLRTFTHHGCPLKCTFCADRLSGSFVLPAQLLESDLRALRLNFPHRSGVYIGDLTFGVSAASVANLKRSLSDFSDEQNRFRLIVQTTPALITPRFVADLHELGVSLVELGVESGESGAVRRIQKFRPSTEWLEDKINILLDNKIQVAGNIIVGLPDDTHADFEQTVSFILRWRKTLWVCVMG